MIKDDFQPPPAKYPHWLVAGLLAALAFAIYFASPVSQSVTDARYTPLVAEHLIWRGSLKLDPSFQPPMDPSRYPSQRADGYPYQMIARGGHVYYIYPPGTALLIAPAVWVMNLAGLSSHDGNWLYEPDADIRMQNILAPLVTTLFVVLVYLLAVQRLPQWRAVAVTVVAAFGTMAFSTASRGLWSDTLGIVLLQAALFLAVAGDSSKPDKLGGLIGSIAAWLVLVRPTYATAVIVFGIWLALHRRKLLGGFLAWGAAWAVLFAAFLKWQTGSVLPMYSSYGGMMTIAAIPEALPGHLLSPSRGLLVLVPVLWWVLWMAARVSGLWRGAEWQLAVIGTAAHLALISCWPIWWGGHCFGPRLTIGALPFLVLAGIEAMRVWRPGTFGRIVLATLAALSIAIHATGAYSRAAWAWNARPGTADATPGGMWDWRYPQVLAGVLPAPLPRTFPELPSGGVVSPGEDRAGRVFVRGWSWGEAHWRWTDGKSATAVFTHPGASKLRLSFYPFLGQGKLASQRVVIRANGTELFRQDIDEKWGGYLEVPLPPAEDGRYQIGFELPDATSPASLGGGDDTRTLGIRLESFSVE
ncbi:hypothetical protein GC173_03870 [bacterium]|nr:hypothetical protein [bacterium]